MPIGIVQYFIAEKGYGFIRIPETKEEIYVRKKDVPSEMILERGMSVQFEIAEDRHGFRAIKVKRVEDH